MALRERVLKRRSPRCPPLPTTGRAELPAGQSHRSLGADSSSAYPGAVRAPGVAPVALATFYALAAKSLPVSGTKQRVSKICAYKEQIIFETLDELAFSLGELPAVKDRMKMLIGAVEILNVSGCNRGQDLINRVDGATLVIHRDAQEEVPPPEPGLP